MVKYKKGIFLSSIFCVFVLSQNVSPFEEDCPGVYFTDHTHFMVLILKARLFKKKY
jgi:hypothetical protein